MGFTSAAHDLLRLDPAAAGQYQVSTGESMGSAQSGEKGCDRVR